MGKNKLKSYTLLTLFSVFLLNSVSAQRSLYSDIKAHNVGDIITVILKESTSGSSTSDSKLSTSADGSTGGSVTGNFLPFQPVFGADVNVDFGADERNLTSQRQLLEGFISVQITEVTPRGDLIVEGNRLMEVNGEVHEMSVSGVVRQNDVNSHNQVLSYRIANANIKYQKKGGLKKKKRHRGILKKVVYTGVTLGLGAAIIVKSLND